MSGIGLKTVVPGDDIDPLIKIEELRAELIEANNTISSLDSKVEQLNADLAYVAAMSEVVL